MKLLKGLFLIGLFKLCLILIFNCNNKGFFYKWQDIIIQETSNGEITNNDNISQSGFGLKVNLINTKSDNAINYITSPENYAYAGYDPASNYNNINSLKKINIFLLSTDINGETFEIVTDNFVPQKYNPDDLVKPPIEQLIDQINNVNSRAVENFDLFLKEPFTQNVSGRFIVEIVLSDERVLADTTRMLNLTL
jgi:hypothetical protein